MLKDIFKKEGETIRFYIGSETQIDPMRNDVEFEKLASYPAIAIVVDLNFTQIHWKLQGVSTDKAKQIIIKKQHLSLLKNSYKIKIKNEFYNGWKVNGKLQYRQEGNYITAYVYQELN